MKLLFIGTHQSITAVASSSDTHGSVEPLVMVDLDKKVIDVCKKFLPKWGGEDVASNPRLDLVIGNAHAYLMNTSERFDVIIMDIPDPIEAKYNNGYSWDRTDQGTSGKLKE